MVDEVWERSPAKGSDLLLLLAIAYLADDDGYLTATMNTISEKARMSASTAFRAVRNLEDHGLLKVLERGAGRSPSRYAVLGSSVNLTVQAADTADRSGVNLTQQADDPALLGQSDTTTGEASGVNLTVQAALLCQSDSTTGAPIEGTRARARLEVGRQVGINPPTYLPETTERARDETAASDGHVAADSELTQFISGIDFKRALGTDEFNRIAALVAAKRNDGWSYLQIRDAVDGRWQNVNDRVAIVTARLRRLPVAAPAPPKPKRAGRCELHLLPLPCIGCDADAKAARAEDEP